MVRRRSTTPCSVHLRQRVTSWTQRLSRTARCCRVPAPRWQLENIRVRRVLNAGSARPVRISTYDISDRIEPRHGHTALGVWHEACRCCRSARSAPSRAPVQQCPLIRDRETLPATTSGLTARPTRSTGATPRRRVCSSPAWKCFAWSSPAPWKVDELAQLSA